MKRLSVTLRLYYGQVTYDAKGQVTSKNEPVKIQYGTPEWGNFLKHLKANGITKVEVEGIYDLDEVNKEKPIESLDRYALVEDKDLQAEIDEYFKIPEKELTPEQKQIKDLQEQVKALSALSAAKPTKQQAVNKEALSAAK